MSIPQAPSAESAALRFKSPAQIEASIERFRDAFWARRSTSRPPIGVVPERTWLPIGYLRRPFERRHVGPDDVSPEHVRSDYEDGAIGRAVLSDDWLPYSSPWRGVPWLEAMAGCRVRFASGSLAPEPCAGSATELAGRSYPAAREWQSRLEALTSEIAASLPQDCFAAPTILRGPSDVLAAIRGLSNFYLDLFDDPRAVAAAAAQANRMLMNVLERHFELVSPRLGGYGHIYGYWAPGPTNVLQEDVLGMCSPAVYRDIFMPLNEKVVQRSGPYTMFHLHSTGLRHYRHVMDVPGLAGLEITVESNGPRLAGMLPILREILERTRLMLFVDAWYEDLPAVLRGLPSDGLYLVISDKFIGTEDEFRGFVAANY